VSEYVVDARGQRCPQPVIALGRAAKAAPPGSEIQLLSDDPVSITDVPAWCRMRAARLVRVQDEKTHWLFVVTTQPEHR
jgi:tRNA 2-thiouridine synthesizing protein A